MDSSKVKNIPKNRTVTYGQIEVNYRAHKTNPNRVRITAGGNLIKHPGDITTLTADLTTSEKLWNSVLSTKGARYMCIDIKDFYLCAPMDRYEFMRMPISLFPKHIIKQYDLIKKLRNGFIYLEIRRIIYGLPQLGMLTNKYLKEKLAHHGYYKVPHTPGLWKHISCPILFGLVVDNLDVNYVVKDHVDHLIRTLKSEFTISKYWEGTLYCGISL